MTTSERDASEIAVVRAEHARVILEQARLVNIGGTAWNVYRGAGGDGINTRAGTRGQPVDHVINPLYVWGAEDERSAASAPGTQVGDVVWTAVAALGTDLQPEDVVESVAIPRLRFTVKVVPPMAEHVQAELEPRAR